MSKCEYCGKEMGYVAMKCDDCLKMCAEGWEKEKPLSETHPSLEIQTILSGKPFVWVADVQKHTTDNQRIREVFKKSIYDLQYTNKYTCWEEAVDDILETLGLEE